MWLDASCSALAVSTLYKPFNHFLQRPATLARLGRTGRDFECCTGALKAADPTTAAIHPRSLSRLAICAGA